MKRSFLGLVLFSIMLIFMINPAVSGSKHGQKDAGFQVLNEKINSQIHDIEKTREAIKNDIADFEKKSKEAGEIFSRHVAIMSYAFNILAVFAGILAVLGCLIPYLTYRQNVASFKEQDLSLKEQEASLRLLVEEGKRHTQSLQQMVANNQAGRTGLTSAVIEAAKNEAARGTGDDVLLAKAILAEQEKDWRKAFFYWSAILESNSKNILALNGAGSARWKQFLYEDGGRSQENINYILEAENYVRTAMEINPTPREYVNLSAILLTKAATSLDNNLKNSSLQEVEDLVKKALNCGEKQAYYNLACMHALRNNVKECIDNLKNAYIAGVLPTKSFLNNDIDLASVRNCPEFKEFIDGINESNCSKHS